MCIPFCIPVPAGPHFPESVFFAESVEFCGTHVGIKSFQGKINLFRNQTESGIPAGTPKGRTLDMVFCATCNEHSLRRQKKTGVRGRSTGGQHFWRQNLTAPQRSPILRNCGWSLTQSMGGRWQRKSCSSPINPAGLQPPEQAEKAPRLRQQAHFTNIAEVKLRCNWFSLCLFRSDYRGSQMSTFTADKLTFFSNSNENECKKCPSSSTGGYGKAMLRAKLCLVQQVLSTEIIESTTPGWYSLYFYDMLLLFCCQKLKILRFFTKLFRATYILQSVSWEVVKSEPTYTV
jgi:hypothetical protein